MPGILQDRHLKIIFDLLDLNLSSYLRTNINEEIVPDGKRFLSMCDEHVCKGVMVDIC